MENLKEINIQKSDENYRHILLTLQSRRSQVQGEGGGGGVGGGGGGGGGVIDE